MKKIILTGAVTLFDFETLTEIKAAPQGADGSRSFAVEKSSKGQVIGLYGDAPYVFEGVEVPAGDWRRFDRQESR